MVVESDSSSDSGSESSSSSSDTDSGPEETVDKEDTYDGFVDRKTSTLSDDFVSRRASVKDTAYDAADASRLTAVR